MLTNLLDNALRFTPAGGTVRFSAEHEGRWIRTSVANTGIGIPAQHLPDVWERFYQVDEARTLSPERGTGFSVTLPLSAAVPAPQ